MRSTRSVATAAVAIAPRQIHQKGQALLWRIVLYHDAALAPGSVAQHA
jgi:hypothetical protein